MPSTATVFDRPPRFWQALRTLLRHRLVHPRWSERVLPPEALERIGERVRESERRHGGQIRVVVEAALPLSYLWRHLRDRVPLRRIVRERALMLFGKLRVWDTERNNGVLIYLLLAERAIEIVADRGIARRVPSAQWQAVVDGLRQALAQGRFESGLAEAVDAVSALLEAHAPRSEAAANNNELPDAPLRL